MSEGWTHKLKKVLKFKDDHFTINCKNCTKQICRDEVEKYFQNEGYGNSWNVCTWLSMRHKRSFKNYVDRKGWMGSKMSMPNR